MGSKSGPKSVTRLALLLLCIGAISALTVATVVIAANSLKNGNALRPEIVLPLVVITGVVALLATLAIMAAAFGLFDLADKSQALGLPAGSVQAVIALSLILIFAVVALYARSESGTDTYQSTGLSAAEFKALPPTEIVESDKTVNNGEVEYTVVRSIEDSNAKDIDTQLLATVSTLVVAVSGFYFGSRSAQEGGKAVLDATGPTRTLSLVNPTSPEERSDLTSQLTGIRLQSVPADAQLRWSIDGDAEGLLARLEDGTFTYVPADVKPGGTVNLHFEQVDDPKVTDTLVVKFPTEDPASEVAEQPAPDGGESPPSPTTTAGSEADQPHQSTPAEKQQRLKDEAAKRPRLKLRADEEAEQARPAAPPPEEADDAPGEQPTI